MKLQDLKRGMRCTTRDEDVFIVGSVIIDNQYENSIAYLEVSKNSNIGFTNMNEDLTGRYSNNDIMKVEDITMNGYKTIWEREEPEYYLRLPKDLVGKELLYSYYLNFNKLEKKYFFDTKLQTTISKTQFTQAEIDKLDTTHLIKEEVK